MIGGRGKEVVCIRDLGEIAKVYDRIASIYDGVYGGEQLSKYKAALSNGLMNYLRRIRNVKLADLGCGTALLLNYLLDVLGHNYGIHYVGIDVSINMINEALQKLKNTSSTMYDFIVADINNPPLRVNYFNIVTSISALCNFEDLVKLITYISEQGFKGLLLLTYIRTSLNKKCPVCLGYEAIEHGRECIYLIKI
ncbi:MAG TPA: methyltransferase domain-containing protein [Acidilobales archaeon]|nr:methyltransferase domain-containing protein [Acidilobales archaeon]